MSRFSVRIRATPPPTLPAPRMATRIAPGLAIRVEGCAEVIGEAVDLTRRQQDLGADLVSDLLEGGRVEAAGDGTADLVRDRACLAGTDLDDVETLVGLDDAARRAHR